MAMRSSSAGPEVPGIEAAAREAQVVPPESESDTESESGSIEPEPSGAAAAPEPQPGCFGPGPGPVCSSARDARGRYAGSRVSRTSFGRFHGQTSWVNCRLTGFWIELDVRLGRAHGHSSTR